MSASTVCAATLVQVPETGRWQELAFSQEEVEDLTAIRYQEILREEQASGRLDDDFEVLDAVRNVGPGLVQVAVSIAPQAANWHWAMHTTSDETYEALCMPGGEVLVGSRFVRQVALSHGELATLLAHEVAHAIANHYREELTAAWIIEGRRTGTRIETTVVQLDTDLSLQLKLAQLSRIQESEADQLGMILAHRAGWPAASMVSFYRKLAMLDGAGFADWTHPSSSSRLSMASALALVFQH